MMRRKTFTLVLSLLLLSATALSAQKIGLKIGMNLGGSRLYHNTDYESTVVQDLYQYAEELFNKKGLEYTWEEFAEANQLNSSFLQPRFGFSAHFTYADWPAFMILEGMSSTSGYEKMAYAATVGMGREFEVGDNIGMLVSAYGGYKFVYDKGWGANTILNGVGDKSLRRNLETIFAPQEPLGSKRGNLFTVRLGIGKLLGETQNITVGTEAYGELDLTDRTQRQARMTNIGAHIYMRFRILGKEGRNYSPPAYGH